MANPAAPIPPIAPIIPIPPTPLSPALRHLHRHGFSHDDVAACAYLIWEAEGRPVGRDRIHWAQAEYQLLASYLHEQWVRSRRGPHPFHSSQGHHNPHKSRSMAAR